MKKFLYIILTALAVIPFVACQQEEEVYKPEVKDITVVSVKNLVFLPAGGSGSINVDCATSFTATSDKSWCTVAVNGKEVTVTASANPTNESRYASILMKTSQSSQTVVVQQVGEILSGLALADLEIPQKGKSLVYGYLSNLSVSMSSDQDWVHFEMVDDEDEGTMVYVTIDENPAFRIRRATVTYQAGSQSKSAVFTQLPKFGAVSGWTVDDTGGRFVFPDQIDEITVTPPSDMAGVYYMFAIGSVDDFPTTDVDAQVEEACLGASAELRAMLSSGEIQSLDDVDGLLKGKYVDEFSNLPGESKAFIACFDDEGYPTGQYALIPVSIPDRGPVKQLVDGWEIAHVGGTYTYPVQTDQFTITPKAGYENAKYIATVVSKDAVSSIEDFAFTTFAMSTRDEIHAKVENGELSSFEAGLSVGETTLSVENMAGSVYVVVVEFGDNKFYTGNYTVAEMTLDDVEPVYYKWVGKWTLTGTYLDDTPFSEVVTISVDEDDRNEDGSLRERRLIISGLDSKAVEAWGAPAEINKFYLKFDAETGAITFYGQNSTGTFTRSGLGDGCKLQLMSMYVKAGATSYTNATGYDFMSATLDGESAAKITILERSAGLPWLVARIRCVNAANSAYTTTGANDASIKLDQPLTMTRAD